MTVGSILRKSGQVGSGVDTIGKTQTIRDAIATLAEKKIGIVLVVDESSGDPVGILSERDVVRVLGSDDTAAMDLPVAEVMTPEPVMCEKSTGIDEAIQKMTAKRCRHLPVRDGEDIVGIISARDIMVYMVESATKNERERIVAMIALA